jgi:hypothetical protein
MNLRRTAEDWEKLAGEYGYTSMYNMLYKWYVDRGMSIRVIGGDLGISKDRVVQLLKIQGIPMRKRGGVR